MFVVLRSLRIVVLWWLTCFLVACSFDATEDVKVDTRHDVASLPVGMFDSGIGGLTVLNELVKLDSFHQTSGQQMSDGVLDFSGERFIYFADQANMPYGLYEAEKNIPLLQEHIVKAASFLLDTSYALSPDDTLLLGRKPPAKLIVIACNTATAYGIDHVKEEVARRGLETEVFGVIDAGAEAALKCLAPNEKAGIAVFATVGTVNSNGYVKAIHEKWSQIPGTERPDSVVVYQQGGLGLAEAIEEISDYVDKSAASVRQDYKGPAFENGMLDSALLDVYQFDYESNRMLCDDDDSNQDCRILQINDIGNYVRYHIVSLLEQIRLDPGKAPLKAIILGCTHYPFVVDEIRATLEDLRAYKKNGAYVYRSCLADQIQLIDPSVTLAQDVYRYMQHNQLLSQSVAEGQQVPSQFYISVPDEHHPGVVLDSSGHFTYAFKYGRIAGEDHYTQIVPMLPAYVPGDKLALLEKMIPETMVLLQEFWSSLQ